MVVRVTSFSAVLALGLAGAVCAEDQGEGVERPAISNEEILAIIEKTEAQLTSVDDLVATLDVKLDGLYDQRDAVMDNPEHVRRLDDLIDRQTLTLNEMEATRAQLVGLLETLRPLVSKGEGGEQ